MDHTKLVLIVSLSVFVIILSVVGTFVGLSPNEATTVDQTSPLNQQADDVNTPLAGQSTADAQNVPEPEEVEYSSDVNGCGGKDNTVWCSTTSSCVAPGTCEPAIIEGPAIPPVN